MATDVLMPKLSDTMEEGKILKWLKQPGDRVKSGDLIAEVETDKANMEVESFDEGVVQELRVKEGDSVPVGAVIAVLGAEGEAPAASKPAAAKKEEPKKEEPKKDEPKKDEPKKDEPKKEEPKKTEAKPAPKEAAVEKKAETGASDAPAAKPAPAPAKESGGVKASPLAKKIATERGVDLSTVRGTGPGGRIVREDVEGAGGAAPAPSPRPAEAAPVAAGRQELSRTRKTTAKRMADAKRDIPHFYVSADLEMDEAVRVREQLVKLGGAFDGVTVTHLLVKACGMALRRVPEMNASPDVDGIVVHEHVNGGIATATEQGLLVPVVKDVDTTPIADVVARARAVVGRARAGKPGGDDLSGATFTISNLGMFPVSNFAAVVNPPQAAILAVGTIRDVPVARAGAIVPGKLMTVTLSCDHRVVDGALAGRFLGELKALIENPLALVV
jgi:pyruvate dehydrogenase E2 component (dihydrolipoamide acetyltransferase)